MNRRDFFKTVGIAGAATIVSASVAEPAKQIMFPDKDADWSIDENANWTNNIISNSKPDIEVSQYEIALYDDNNKEVSDSAYSRQSVYFENAKDGSLYNKNEITFSGFTSDFTTVDSYVIVDSSGNKLFSGDFDVKMELMKDSTLKIATKNLTISID